MSENNKEDQNIKTSPFAFEPLDLSGDITLTPEGRKIELTFKKTSFFDDAPDKKNLKNGAIELIASGYDYLRGLLGDDFPYLANKYFIEVRPGRLNQEMGTMMYLSVGEIRRYLDPNVSERRKWRPISTPVHEMLHSITDDEALPMLAELIHSLDNGQAWVAGSFKQQYLKGELPEIHRKGLETLKEWLGGESVPLLLDGITIKSMDGLKNIFREKALELGKE